MSLTAEQVAALSDAEAKRLLGLLMSRRTMGLRKRGKWVGRLAAMVVGDSFVTPELLRSNNLCQSKRIARVRMQAPDAQWATRTTNHGLRVTRTR